MARKKLSALLWNAAVYGLGLLFIAACFMSFYNELKPSPREVTVSVWGQSTSWGTSWHASVKDTSHSYPDGCWRYSWDNGATWYAYGVPDSERYLTMQRDWVGSIWRYVVEIDDEEGSGQTTIASEPFGPVTLKQYGKYSTPEVGFYCSPVEGKQFAVYWRVQQGSTFAFQWQRADAADGEFQNIDGATSGAYTPTADDVGKYLRCSYAIDLDGYEQYRGATEAAGPVAASKQSGTAVQGGSSKSSLAVYVCESASESLYHTSDCDDLSLLRSRGYGVSELTLAEAKARGYRACSSCNPPR
jgi:hypothetical protein